MKRFLYIKFILVLTVFLYGCAGHSEIVKQELDGSANMYIGKSKDVLLLTKGAPDYKETLSNGDIIWTYRVTKTGEKKGVMLRIGGGDEPLRRPIISWLETTNFIIDEYGIVKQAYTSVN